MSATDELRRMLNEAGVEWEDYQHENHTWWFDGNDVCWHAENRLTPSGVLLKIEATLTPEQAIAATVGNAALEAENAKLRELVKRYHYLVTGTDELWSWQSVYEQLRELGIEVPDV